MKNQKSTIRIRIGILICGLLVSIQIIQASLEIIPVLNIFNHEAASIGLIGGADGPVSFFISFPLGALFFMPIIELIGMVYILVMLIHLYRENKAKNVDGN